MSTLDITKYFPIRLPHLTQMIFLCGSHQGSGKKREQAVLNTAARGQRHLNPQSHLLPGSPRKAETNRQHVPSPGAVNATLETPTSLQEQCSQPSYTGSEECVYQVEDVAVANTDKWRHPSSNARLGFESRFGLAEHELPTCGPSGISRNWPFR